MALSGHIISSLERIIYSVAKEKDQQSFVRYKYNVLVPWNRFLEKQIRLNFNKLLRQLKK